MEKRKRIDLRVRLENPSEAEALIKIQNYDKEKYNSIQWKPAGHVLVRKNRCSKRKHQYAEGIFESNDDRGKWML